MLRRLFGFLLILAILAGAGLVGYAYLAELPPKTGPIETPAVGVGFGD